MATVENIRSGLIDKIQTIRNKDLLITIDSIISSSYEENEVLELSKELKEILEMSEADIHHGRLISQESMNKRNREWLNGL